MENEKQVQKQGEEEISLIDLFTVLLRYRKLIIGITLVSVILAVAGYFIYPLYKNKISIENPEFIGKMNFAVRQQLRKYVTQNLDVIVNNAELIYESMRDAGVKEFYDIPLTDDDKRSRVLYLINEYLIRPVASGGKASSETRKNPRIYIPNTRDAFIVEVLFKDHDIDVIKAFLSSVFERSNSIIESYIHSDIITVVENYERLSSPDDVPQSIQTLLDRDFGEYIFYKSIVDGKEAVLTQIGDSIITEVDYSLSTLRKDFRIKSMLIAASGFFIAIFLAFMLNAIRCIKNDEEAMAKIRDALGKTES